MWDLVGFGKPLKDLKQWDDKLCFHLTTVWRLGRECGGSHFAQTRMAGHRQGQDCFEAAQLISGIAGPKTPAVVFALIDISHIVFHS